MKKILLPLIFCFILISCASTRKSVQMSCTSQTNTESAEKQTSKAEKVVDTTKTESGKVTITEIEFYPPSDCQHDKNAASEAPPKKPKADKPKGNNVGEINLPNIGNIKDAAIKSIKQTTIESEKEQKGESKESNESDNSKNQATLSNTSQSGTEESTPAPDPYRWRYIFYILLIVAIGLLYMKRVPILNWIKTILSGIRKIF